MDGEPVANEVAYGGRNAFYSLLTGMGPELRDYSIGNVMFTFGIERACAHGFRELHLGGINDLPHFAYKKRWLTHTRGGRELIVTRPRSWFGRLHGVLTTSPRATRLWARFKVKDRAMNAFDFARGLKRR